MTDISILTRVNVVVSCVGGLGRRFADVQETQAQAERCWEVKKNQKKTQHINIYMRINVVHEEFIIFVSKFVTESITPPVKILL